MSCSSEGDLNVNANRHRHLWPEEMTVTQGICINMSNTTQHNTDTRGNARPAAFKKHQWMTTSYDTRENSTTQLNIIQFNTTKDATTQPNTTQHSTQHNSKASSKDSSDFCLWLLAANANSWVENKGPSMYVCVCVCVWFAVCNSHFLFDPPVHLEQCQPAANLN